MYEGGTEGTEGSTEDNGVGERMLNGGRLEGQQDDRRTEELNGRRDKRKERKRRKEFMGGIKAFGGRTDPFAGRGQKGARTSSNAMTLELF